LQPEQCRANGCCRGIKTTCQFSAKICYQDGGKTPHLWTSDSLEHYKFDADKYNFKADGCSLELSEDGSYYTIKSTVNKKCVVDLKVARAAPGFVAGKDGTSYFGENPKEPWGSMRHAFWPRCNVQGSFMTQAGEVDMTGRGMYVFALQGMQPHHAAARWNFVNFQSPTYSAVMMEFTTPPSYGSTVVNVGGIVTDNKIVMAGCACTAKHVETTGDTKTDWPEPKVTKYEWKGKTPDGIEASAEVGGELGTRLDRIDVMAEVPAFVKQIVANVAGTKPYIYQYGPKMTLRINVDGEEKEEEGTLFTEATFIT